jgi:hypothetical protein
MYYEAFKAMQLTNEHLMPYNGTLVGFAGEQLEVMGYTMLLTTFGENDNGKTVKVGYLVVKTPFTSYNIIIGRPAFNALGAAMSTLYLSMKYPLDDRRIGTVRGDQALARRCYESSLKIKHRAVNAQESSRPDAEKGEVNMISPLDLDPREEFQDRRVSPIEELEQVQIGEATHQTTNLGTALQPEKRKKIMATLKKNIDMFA